MKIQQVELMIYDHSLHKARHDLDVLIQPAPYFLQLGATLLISLDEPLKYDRLIPASGGSVIAAGHCQVILPDPAVGRVKGAARVPPARCR